MLHLIFLQTPNESYIWYSAIILYIRYIPAFSVSITYYRFKTKLSRWIMIMRNKVTESWVFELSDYLRLRYLNLNLATKTRFWFVVGPKTSASWTLFVGPVTKKVKFRTTSLLLGLFPVMTTCSWQLFRRSGEPFWAQRTQSSKHLLVCSTSFYLYEVGVFAVLRKILCR